MIVGTGMMVRVSSYMDAVGGWAIRVSATGNEQKHCDKLVLTKRARFMIGNMVYQHEEYFYYQQYTERKKRKYLDYKFLFLRYKIFYSMPWSVPLCKGYVRQNNTSC